MCDIWELLKLMATLSTWTRRDSMELTGMLLFLHHYGKGEALCSVSCCKAFWEPKSSRKGQKYTNIQFFFSFTVLTFFTNTIQYCNRWQFVCIKLLIPGLVLRLLFPRTGIFLEGIHMHAEHLHVPLHVNKMGQTQSLCYFGPIIYLLISKCAFPVKC